MKRIFPETIYMSQSSNYKKEKGDTDSWRLCSETLFGALSLHENQDVAEYKLVNVKKFKAVAQEVKSTKGDK